MSSKDNEPRGDGNDQQAGEAELVKVLEVLKNDHTPTENDEPLHLGDPLDKELAEILAEIDRNGLGQR